MAVRSVWQYLLCLAPTLALPMAFFLALCLGHPVSAQTLQSGNQFLTPQLQAMQQDADANPVSLWVEKGQALWGNSCQSCHNAPQTLRTAAAQHPRLKTSGNTHRLLNLEDQINTCRQRLGQTPKGVEDDDTLSLSALLHSVAKGQKIDTQPPADAAAQQHWQDELSQGAQLYGTRLGRLNLACVHCHDGKVGAHLRAEVVSPGHPSGFPIYRLNWQNMGSIDRRLRACYSGVQATLPAPGSASLRKLELFLKVRANGMPLDGPSIRR